MILSTVIIISGVKLFIDKKEAKIYEICAKQLIEISQNIVKHYQTSPSYWGLSTEVVINKKLYTNNMKATNDTLLNMILDNVDYQKIKSIIHTLQILSIIINENTTIFHTEHDTKDLFVKLIKF